MHILPLCVALGSLVMAQHALSQDLSFSQGRLIAQNQTTISAPLQGVLVELVVKDLSAPVKAGDVIAKLDCSVIKAEQAAARARAVKASNDVKQAKAEYNYITPDGVPMATISKDELSSTKSNAHALWSDANAKKAMLDQCSIKAPFDGIVANVHVHEGEFLQAGAPIVDLVDNTTLYAQVDVVAWAWDQHQPGNEVQAKLLDINADADATIRITQRSNQIDENTNRFTIRGELIDASIAPVAGMPVFIFHETKKTKTVAFQ